MPLQISEPSLADHPLSPLVDLFFDIMFIIDMCINFCVPYTDANGMIVDDHDKIAMAYIKSWFFIDLSSSLPISFIVYIMKDDSSDNVLSSSPETEGSDELLANSSLIFLKIPR